MLNRLRLATVEYSQEIFMQFTCDIFYTQYSSKTTTNKNKKKKSREARGGGRSQRIETNSGQGGEEQKETREIGDGFWKEEGNRRENSKREA